MEETEAQGGDTGRCTGAERGPDRKTLVMTREPSALCADVTCKHLAASRGGVGTRTPVPGEDIEAQRGWGTWLRSHSCPAVELTRGPAEAHTWSPAPACTGQVSGPFWGRHGGRRSPPRHRPQEQALSSSAVLGGDFGEPHRGGARQGRGERHRGFAFMQFPPTGGGGGPPSGLPCCPAFPSSLPRGHYVIAAW